MSGSEFGGRNGFADGASRSKGLLLSCALLCAESLPTQLVRQDSTIRSLERVLELEAKKQRMQRDKALQEAQEESIVPAERRVPLLKEKVEKLQLELDKMTELHQIESTARQVLRPVESWPSEATYVAPID